jgi:SAM-dependent methyltransferase
MSSETVENADSVYDRGEFAKLDIGARMRNGHIDVADGDARIVETVRTLLADRREPATIVDIGSGSGVLCELLAKALPNHNVVANETAGSNIAHARARLAKFPNARVFGVSFDQWVEPADVFISWGSHHHMPHNYLHKIRELLKPGGRFIVGDEFCPEYLTPAELSAGTAWIVDGYLFTSKDEERAYREKGAPPASVLQREEARRKALWTWYRYVIDQAVEQREWEVATLELQIARDDLVTAFADEHKTSPLLLETEMRAAGLEVLSKVCLGDREAALQSFVIYEAVPANATR